jgi:hypothetical protein
VVARRREHDRQGCPMTATTSVGSTVTSQISTAVASQMSQLLATFVVIGFSPTTVASFASLRGCFAGNATNTMLGITIAAAPIACIALLQYFSENEEKGAGLLSRAYRDESQPKVLAHLGAGYK